MNAVVAITGWHWVKKSFTLFSRQPLEMLGLFMAYMLVNIAIGLIPVLGEVLPVLLIPVFAMAFMQACWQIEQGKKVRPDVLLVGFKSPLLFRLMSLGAMYLLAIMLAVLASQLFDGGELLKMMSEGPAFDPKNLEGSRIGAGVLGSLLCFLPAVMAFWFAGPLIMWRRQSLIKALFFSFVAVKRAWRAFLLYGLCWLLIAGFLPVMLLQVLVQILSQANLMVLLMMPVLALLTTIRYCSFYPSYADVFGAPDLDPATPNAERSDDQAGSSS